MNLIHHVPVQEKCLDSTTVFQFKLYLQGNMNLFTWKAQPTQNRLPVYTFFTSDPYLICTHTNRFVLHSHFRNLRLCGVPVYVALDNAANHV